MNYFKKQNGSIWYFDDDQLDLVHDDMVMMTADEIDKHVNPQKYLTEAEKYSLYLNSLPSLTRRQFKLALFDAGLLATVEANLTDPRIAIEYAESTTFDRNSPTVTYMSGLLGLTDEQVDDMWQQALTL